MTVEIASDFTITVRNCSGEEAASLIDLYYSNPGGTRSDPNQYGTDNMHILFPLTDQEISIPILGMTEELASVADVWVTGYTVNGSPFADRLLGKFYANAYEGTPPGYLVALTPELEERSNAEVKLMAIENPQSPPSDRDCALFESQQVVAFNRGREDLFGTIQNKVLCTTDPTTPLQCNATNSSTANHAQEDLQMNLKPEDIAMIFAKDDPAGEAGQLHDVCCDPGHSTVAVIECGTVIIDEIVVNGLRERLDPVFRLDVRDIRPIGGVLNETDINFGCVEIGANFESTISQSVTQIRDLDDDGVDDFCDHVIVAGNSQQSGDPLKPLVRRRIRNRDFNDTGAIFNALDATTIADVQVDGLSLAFQEATDPTNNTTGTIEVTIPAAVTAGTKQFIVFPNTSSPDVVGTNPAPARNLYTFHRQVGFVSMGASDYVRPFDEATGQFVDLDTASRNDSVPNLPGGLAPDGVLFTTEPGNENNEVLIAAGTDIFAYKVAGNQFLDLNLADPNTLGVSLGSAVGALALPVGTPSDRVGEFLFALHGDRDLSVVDVRSGLPSRGDVRPAAALNASGAVATDLVVRALPGDEFVVYVTFSCIQCESLLVTSSTCGVAPLAPLTQSNVTIKPCPPCGCDGGEPGGCGGGGGGGGGGRRRTVGVSILHLQARFTGTGALKSGAQAFDVLCYDDVPLSGFGGVADETLDQNALPWAQVGLDFTTDGSELFIVDPERDQLFILDTTTNELVMDGSIPKTIPVGVDPFDIEIMHVPADFVMQDRAYVANHGDEDENAPQDDTLTIVDTVNRELVLPHLNLNTAFSTSGFAADNLEIERLTGSETSKLLFMLSANRERVLVYDMSLDGDSPQALTNSTIITGPEPRQVVVQK